MSDLIPNTNFIEGDNSETIKIMNTSLNDIKIEATNINTCSIDSMACTGVETIGDIKINL